MSEEYPLFPDLSPEAEEQAQKLMDGFKVKISKLCEEVLDDLYCDVSMYIQSDHWTNYRNHLLEGMRNYNNRHLQAEPDFAKIRKAIYEEYKDELIVDMNKDLLDEIESLKQDKVMMQRWLDER